MCVFQSVGKYVSMMPLPLETRREGGRQAGGGMEPVAPALALMRRPR